MSKIKSESPAQYVMTEPTPQADQRRAMSDPSDETVIAQALKIIDRQWLLRGDVMTDPVAAGRYFKLHLGRSPDEMFAVLFLDTKHRVLAFEPLFRGTVDGAEIHPRVVVRRALELNASAAIIGHNHPSGNPDPSAADKAVTVRLKAALALVDVRLLDHFICGDGEPLSMASRGLV